GDGMQNSWETLYGLNPNSAADADQDKDGDGQSNKAEFLAGTNPNDGGAFVCPIITHIANGYKITFTAQSRKSYAIRYKDTLSAGTWTNLQTIAEQTGVRTSDGSEPGGGTERSRVYQV